MKNFIKKNYKIVVAFIMGIIVSGTVVYAATILSSSEVFYDNSKSGGSSNSVQGAIEELYEKSSKCTTGSCSLTKSNFFVGYTYNEDKNSANYCVTGDEATCVRTDCYTSSAKTCPAGTIIDYIVSGTNTRVRFHVIEDKGRKIVMQSQRNIVRNTKWYTSQDTTKGPLTILSKLESATIGWTNVDNQTYTMGETVFKDNAYTGCSPYNNCYVNHYTLEQRTAKARMITAQEAASVGCTGDYSSCPKWMYNYLYQSTSYGGTVNDTSKDSATGLYNEGYWLMSSNSTAHAYLIWSVGAMSYNFTTISYDGARAVILVSK